MQPIIRGNPDIYGTVYTYIGKDGTITSIDKTVRDYTYPELQRMVIERGHIRVRELEILLLTSVRGRVIRWGAWSPEPRTDKG